jgi:hypothetical protein
MLRLIPTGAGAPADEVGELETRKGGVLDDEVGEGESLLDAEDDKVGDALKEDIGERSAAEAEVDAEAEEVADIEGEADSINWQGCHDAGRIWITRRPCPVYGAGGLKMLGFGIYVDEKFEL